MDLSWLFWVFLIFAAVGRLKQFIEKQQGEAKRRYPGPVAGGPPPAPDMQRRRESAGGREATERRETKSGRPATPRRDDSWLQPAAPQGREGPQPAGSDPYTIGGEGPADMSVADIVQSAAGVAAEADSLAASAEALSGAPDFGRDGLSSLDLAQAAEGGPALLVTTPDEEAASRAVFSSGDLARAVVMSEVLGPPRAMRRHGHRWGRPVR